jgi:iron-sulfur cluster assembly accessory protein
MEFAITPSAEKFVRRMLRLGGAPGGGFRLVMTAEGCSGLGGDFTVETQPHAGDAVHESMGMKFFLPAESRLLLEGVTMDFADTPTQTGLIFLDPKKTACGCGTGQEAKLPQISTIAIGSIGRRT